MYDTYIYASYAVTFILLGGLIVVSFRALAQARRAADKAMPKND
ncbi:MAG: heme exporter protein CcmD [Parvibaculales bacterium]|jgi:hypothetical protein